jgi:enamine deaminase RidA (YjgF/YER057c/UK114 family)
MEKRRIDPWRWQERLGFSQGWRVDGAESVLFLAGQGPAAADGTLVGEGDFEAQVRQPAATALQVGALARPGMMIELDAIAVL